MQGLTHIKKPVENNSERDSPAAYVENIRRIDAARLKEVFYHAIEEAKKAKKAKEAKE
jgi:hypothetical protein